MQTLLSVSGGDAVTIERKHLPDWHGVLPARFVITSNELPQLGDASGALMSRTTRALLDATKGNPRRRKRIFAELQGLWESNTRDVGLCDVLNRLECGTPLPRSTAPAMWRPENTAPAA